MDSRNFTEIRETTRLSPVGECIYCGRTDGLSDEHIIPFALEGNLVLPKASCPTAAAAAGGVLGALIEVSLLPEYGVAGGRAAEYYQFSIAAAATPLMPSDVSVSVQARVRFAFSPRP